MDRIGFGGGCHWCTEAVFQSLRGVGKVEQGFISATAPNDFSSEAVIVEFDPAIITLSQLIKVHLYTHASTSNHSMREKYRSAVYVFDEDQSSASSKVLDDLQAEFDKPLVTRVLPFLSFKPSQERYRNYYKEGRDQPFCQSFIDPKLDLLRKEFYKMVI